MRKFIISEEIAQAIGAYLTKQPYEQVVGLINAMNQLTEAPEQEAPKEEKKK